MKILIVHNRYRSDQPSGENRAVDRQIKLLRASGHTILTFERNSDEIASYGAAARLALPAKVIWSQRTRHDVQRVLERDTPDVVHVHNTFPLITPSVLAPLARSAPTVISLHNYRLLCPHGQLLRHGSPCDLCVGRVPWRGVFYGCYRDSRVLTAPMAIAIQTQRMLDIWNRHASAFIALSAFAANKLAAGGLDRNRLHVLPNFAPRPDRVRTGPGKHFLFIGRLSEEKAPELVVQAWRSEFGRLLIVGDGPLRSVVDASAARHGESVSILGLQPHERTMALLAEARALVISSSGYEAGPLILAEAFARGIPVIAPDLGAFSEFVRDAVTGRLFAPADLDGLAACMNDLREDSESIRMGEQALDVYEQSFAPEQYVRQLLAIYELARSERSAPAQPATSATER